MSVSVRRVRLVRQQRDGLCGIACVEMILFSRGYRVPSLQPGAFCRPGGISIGALLQLASRFGLNGHAYELVFPVLCASWCPSILRIDNVHFVVLADVREDTVLIADPASGFATHNRTSFARRVNEVIRFDK